MRVMVMIKATPDSEAGVMPSTDLLEAMGRFNEELVNAGIMLSGEGLKPSSTGRRIEFTGPDRQVLEGPFAPVGDVVAGFWIWQVRNLDEAVDWVKRCPNPMDGKSQIEIRPVFEMEDFGEQMTPEIAAREDQLRNRLAGE